MPGARRLFWKRQRFPIADAHYAMGFAFLAGDLRQRISIISEPSTFLRSFRRLAARDYEDYCWGYPFDWETRTGTIRAGTPLITTVPYVYEAFSQVYAIDGDQKWLRIMRSIAEHAFSELSRFGDDARCRQLRLYPCAGRPVRGYQCQCLSGLSSDQGRHRALGAAVPSGREKKSEFCSRLSTSRRLLVLFHGWQEGFCRSLSYLLCV